MYPYGENSPIKNFLEKNNNGAIHHICLEVKDIEETCKTLKTKNIRILGDIPLIGWTINAAIKSICNRVIVSTDSK